MAEMPAAPVLVQDDGAGGYSSVQVPTDTTGQASIGSGTNVVPIPDHELLVLGRTQDAASAPTASLHVDVHPVGDDRRGMPPGVANVSHTGTEGQVAAAGPGAVEMAPYSAPLGPVGGSADQTQPRPGSVPGEWTGSGTGAGLLDVGPLRGPTAPAPLAGGLTMPLVPMGSTAACQRSQTDVRQLPCAAGDGGMQPLASYRVAGGFPELNDVRAAAADLGISADTFLSEIYSVLGNSMQVPGNPFVTVDVNQQLKVAFDAVEILMTYAQSRDAQYAAVHRSAEEHNHALRVDCGSMADRIETLIRELEAARWQTHQERQALGEELARTQQTVRELEGTTRNLREACAAANGRAQVLATELERRSSLRTQRFDLSPAPSKDKVAGAQGGSALNLSASRSIRLAKSTTCYSARYCAAGGCDILACPHASTLW